MSNAITTSKPVKRLKLACKTYSTQEVADIIGIGYIAAWKLIKRGIIRALPWLRNKRVTKAELTRYMSGGSQ
jgi:hypothetical protein